MACTWLVSDLVSGHAMALSAAHWTAPQGHSYVLAGQPHARCNMGKWHLWDFVIELGRGACIIGAHMHICLGGKWCKGSSKSREERPSAGAENRLSADMRPRAEKAREMKVTRGRDESKRRRAESQWIVAARPLCHLQYPVAYLSRLQRILPAAR